MILYQKSQRAFKIFRKLGFNKNRFSVYERQFKRFRMNSQSFKTKSTNMFRSIKIVAYHRMIYRFEMNAYLVGSSCLWRHFNIWKIFIFFKHFIICYRVAKISARASLRRPFSKIAFTFDDRSVYYIFFFFYLAAYKYIVDFSNLSFLKLFFYYKSIKFYLINGETVLVESELPKDFKYALTLLV